MPMVQNVNIEQLDVETLAVTWDPPPLIDLCTNTKYFLYYHILETDIKGVSEIYDTNCEISLALEDCLAIEIIIEAESDRSYGRSFEETYHTGTALVIVNFLSKVCL